MKVLCINNKGAEKHLFFCAEYVVVRSTNCPQCKAVGYQLEGVDPGQFNEPNGLYCCGVCKQHITFEQANDLSNVFSAERFIPIDPDTLRDVLLADLNRITSDIVGGIRLPELPLKPVKK